MNNNYLSPLIKKWSPKIITKGSEFLVPVQQAIELAEDLVMADEIIMGCYGWRYVDKSKIGIVQDLGVELPIEELIAWEDMTPKKNLEIIRTFLQELPTNIHLISFQLNDPEIEAKLIEAASSI